MRSKFKKARGEPRLHPAWSAATAGTKISPYICAHYPMGSAAFAMLRNLEDENPPYICAHYPIGSAAFAILLKYHFLGNLHDHMPSNLQTIQNWEPPLYIN